MELKSLLDLIKSAQFEDFADEYKKMLSGLPGGGYGMDAISGEIVAIKNNTLEL